MGYWFCLGLGREGEIIFKRITAKDLTIALDRLYFIRDMGLGLELQWLFGYVYVWGKG